jgi:hypothetical protein
MKCFPTCEGTISDFKEVCKPGAQGFFLDNPFDVKDIPPMKPLGSKDRPQGMCRV